MALARLSLLKDYLKITGTSHDSRLKEALLGATAFASETTRRDYLEKPSSDINEYYTPSEIHRGRLYLRNFPTGTITTIKESFGLDTVDTLASGDYTVFAADGVVRFDDDQPDLAGYNTVEVTYSPGYTTTSWDTAALGTALGDVPVDLERAVMLIAAKFWQDSKQGDGRGGVSSKSRGAESVSFVFRDEAMPKDVEAILGRHTSLGF